MGLELWCLTPLHFQLYRGRMTIQHYTYAYIKVKERHISV